MPFLTVKFKSSMVLVLPALNDLRLNERSTRGRSLVALELRRSARSGFFSPLKSRLFNKQKIAREITHPYARLFGVLVLSFPAAPLQKRGGASGKGWCIRRTRSRAERRLGAEALVFPNIRAEGVYSWRVNQTPALFRIRSCSGDRAGLPRACRDAAHRAGLFSALVPVQKVGTFIYSL